MSACEDAASRQCSTSPSPNPDPHAAYRQSPTSVPGGCSLGEDIIKQVKPRDDWWENGPLASPIQGLAKENSEDPLDRLILNSGVPSYGFLGSSVLLAIAFGKKTPPHACEFHAHVYITATYNPYLRRSPQSGASSSSSTTSRPRRTSACRLPRSSSSSQGRRGSSSSSPQSRRGRRRPRRTTSCRIDLPTKCGPAPCPPTDAHSPLT